MGHIAELIAKNEAYTLAEYSENSFENWIQHYRYATENQARQTSMSDNNTDCLRAMYTDGQVKPYSSPFSRCFSCKTAFLKWIFEADPVGVQIRTVSHFKGLE